MMKWCKVGIPSWVPKKFQGLLPNKLWKIDHFCLSIGWTLFQRFLLQKCRIWRTLKGGGPPTLRFEALMISDEQNVSKLSVTKWCFNPRINKAPPPNTRRSRRFSIIFVLSCIDIIVLISHLVYFLSDHNASPIWVQCWSFGPNKDPLKSQQWCEPHGREEVALWKLFGPIRT